MYELAPGPFKDIFRLSKVLVIVVFVIIVPETFTDAEALVLTAVLLESVMLVPLVNDLIVKFTVPSTII